MGTEGLSTGSDLVARVRRVVGRLKWRVRAQTALRFGLIAGAIGLILFAAAIALTKLRLVDPSTPLFAGLGAIALAALGLTAGLTRRLDDIALAASLDSAASLHSRLGSALAFARLDTPTEMQRLAMKDALTVLDQAEPKRAAPWLFAPFVAGLIALAIALALNVPALWLLDPKVPAGSVGLLGRVAVPAPFERQVVVLKPEDKKTLEVLSEDLEDTRAAADPKVKEALADLNELIRALQEGRITAEDAHARLAELEKALDQWEAQDKQQRAAEEKLAEAAKRLKKTEPTLAEALSELQKRELEEAARRLEELQKKLDRGELDKKTQEKLAKDLAELAKGLKNERQKEKDRLQKERDRLKEKERKEKDRFAQKDKGRLKDIERQLESFDQDQPPESEAQRQLERFSDDLDQAAADLMRRLAEKMGPLDNAPSQEGPEDIARRERERDQAGQNGQNGQDGEDGEQGQEGQPKAGDGDELTDEELEQAAKALKRMAKRAGGRQQMRAAGGKMVDLKEMLRRAAKQGQGGDEKDEFERSARGEGKDGKDGQGQASSGQKPGKGGDMMLLGGKGAGQGGAKIPGKGEGGQANEGQGEGIGEGHDRNLVGEKTGMDVKTVEDFVEGKASDGPSQTKVIMAAAGRGFASRAYRDVHQDYAGVVEDNLEKEHIPAGKRSYVRRYFDLIRPR